MTQGVKGSRGRRIQGTKGLREPRVQEIEGLRVHFFSSRVYVVEVNCLMPVSWIRELSLGDLGLICDRGSGTLRKI